MAILLRAKDFFLSRVKSLTTLQLQRCSHATMTEGDLKAHFYAEMGTESVAQHSHLVDMSKWKKLNAKHFGLHRSMIPDFTWIVLNILRNEGFESYLVGGCVRDLLLHKVPKDFDVVTTAKLKEVKKRFHRCQIIGKRFPICKVHIRGSAVEVSSFETLGKNSKEKENIPVSQMPSSCKEKDFILWRNSMHRDFTINSLFFDPFLNQIYDYANGMADLKSLKLKTIIPPQLSFLEDSARILRGLRIAGRLGLSISEDTETAIHKLSSSIKSLDKFRMMLELNYMLSYGAAESTICLLQRFKLLQIFLPFHAAYLDQQSDGKSAQNSMMMKLFFNLDKMVSSDRPCHCLLWVGLLAFHQALVTKPQDGLAIWAFASILYHGKWNEGVKSAREHAKVQVNFSPEMLGFSEFKSDEELAEEISDLASLVQDSVGALIDEEFLFKSMSRYTVSSHSGLVFVPRKTGNDVAHLFDILVNDIQSYKRGRDNYIIDYNLLGKGSPNETRFVLGKVILETLSGEQVEGLESVKEEPEITEEKCDPTLSDLLKNNLLDEHHKEHAKKGMKIKEEEVLDLEVLGKKCNPTVTDLANHQAGVKKDKIRLLTPQPKQKKAKKQKVKEEVVSEDFQQMAQKHQKVVNTSQLPKEELNIMRTSMLMKRGHHSEKQSASNIKNITFLREQYEDKGGKQRKTKEMVKHHMLDNRGKTQQHHKFNLTNGEKVKMLEKKEAYQLLQVVKKTEKSKKVSHKDEKVKQEEKKERCQLLQMIQKTEEPMQVKETDDWPSLRELFKR